jgi:hypothetical protein
MHCFLQHGFDAITMRTPLLMQERHGIRGEQPGLQHADDSGHSHFCSHSSDSEHLSASSLSISKQTVCFCFLRGFVLQQLSLFEPPNRPIFIYVYYGEF